ncbi:methanol/ethanol family PQQ-dependent dehydrogenase [Microvirga lotononidis]|uniref:PQQ-dependent dehydrogenase, methanol/ethanol family n=1 Tax=Microvirga lotononidis TaxID=864069 RepID=I4YT71_9HYPH|nr:methanol/ethanol family PQQ-dependent dehydrogenase [Microvirga lotononidis]EIM27163.1 PQQ-dependent dehydrogenase, methanol/ethanol family [Microvirga lotononidis]WQO28652.1 methanol/ethanol family PQQ-dependent dehydrogenase [Microvirga lotononidis]
MGGARLALVLAILLNLQPASQALAQTDPPQPAVPSFASAPEDGQWTIPQKNSASTRFSDLSEINTENVKNLQVAFTFSAGVNKGQEAAPLVVGGTMYVLSPFPNILYALDLTQPGAPLKWQYNPKPASAAQGVACCDVVNRGPAFANGRIVFTTLDAHVVAVNAETGEEVWKTRLGDITRGETMTMAPLVVKDKVIVGVSGGQFGVRGWIEAIDINSGKSVWKAYSTGPDQDVKIGPNFKPFYDGDKGQDLGVTTWPADGWQQGGGTVSGWLSYDPDLNLIYHGTGNPGPWNPNPRPGDNKWTAGIFARDADTGEARWFYQIAPHDLHGRSGDNETILLDMEWEGKPRKVLVHPGQTGFVYVIDRTNGELLSAKPFHALTAATGVDLATGRIQYNADKEPVDRRVVRDICPAASGAKNWNPSAFSPKTGLLYIPHVNLCMDWESTDPNYIAGTPYVGAEIRMFPGPGGHMGEFSAWDIRQGRELWTINERFPLWGGALATAGDVVFYGTMDGWFKAVHARTGEVLWQFRTSSGIVGQPTTYRGPDGKQYVAILSGVGGWAGSIVSGDLDPRDATAALGFVNAMRDLKNVTTKGGTLHVFKLP